MRARRERVRIGFDARAFVFPAGGVRRYARELFSRLPAIAPQVEFVAVDAPDGIDVPPGAVHGARALRVATNLARMAFALPLAIRQSHLDLFHAPAYTGPLSSPCPVVLTVHDVSYARRPEFYPHASGPVRRWFYRQSALRATRIITDSEFSRGEIVAAYGVASSRIAVVPLGVGDPFLAGSAGSVSPPAGVRPPYVLHVGELHPRRDLLTALRAVLDVRGRQGSGCPLQLVCAGADRGLAAKLLEASASAGARDAVVLLGAVSENDLVALYRQATALVYPSWYEGFGLPVVEAMACGLPVVAARAGSVPEVLGGAGVLVECGDWRAMANALADLVAHPERASAFRARGLQRAAELTWTRTAERTQEVYRVLLQESTISPADRR